jgi:hypothetical protein
LQREVETLKGKVARLERRENSKRHGVTREREVVSPRERAVSENARAVEILRQAGLLAELTPEEKAMAAEWRALPEEEKRQVREELWNLKLTQPLSQIIIENR